MKNKTNLLATLSARSQALAWERTASEAPPPAACDQTALRQADSAIHWIPRQTQGTRRWRSARSVCVVATLLCGLAIGLVSNYPVMVAKANNGIQIANVPPKGWRRTVSGWERAEEWGKPAAKAQLGINQWLAIQDQRESAIARGLLAQLRSVHPLFISVTLLGAAIAVVLLNERRAMATSSVAHPSRK